MLSKPRRPRLPRLLFVVLLALTTLTVSGCTCKAVSRGWSGPVVSDNVLYVGTLQGKVLAYDINAMEPQWARPVASQGGGGGLFSCSGGGSTPMPMYGTPAVRNDRLYIGAYDGSVLWVARDGSSVSSPNFKTNGPIVGSVVIDEDTLYVGSSDGNVYALDLNVADLSNSLKEGWPFKTGDKVWSTPVVKDKVLYVASADHNLYAIDTESGNEIWRFETEAAILSTPLVANGKVYIGGCDRKFYALEVATPDQRLAAKSREPGTPSDIVKTEENAAVFTAENWFWTQALAFNGQIWVGCLDHKIYALDAETLEYIGEVQTQGMVSAPPVVVRGLVIAGSQDGMIYAIDPNTREFKAYAVDPQTNQIVEWPDKPKNSPAPILAPLLADEASGIIYFHAQDGTHTIHALRLSTKEVVWSFRTDQIDD